MACDTFRTVCIVYLIDEYQMIIDMIANLNGRIHRYKGILIRERLRIGSRRQMSIGVNMAR